jgi:type IVB pilus formation R64 PilN family outer membrane protein
MNSTMKLRKVTPFALIALVSLLAGCGTVREGIVKEKTAADDKIAAEKTRSDKDVPVVKRSQAAWLMGAMVPVAPPPSPLLLQRVTYNPRRPVTLADVATFLTQNAGLSVETSQLASTASTSLQGTAGAVVAAGAPTVPALSGSVMLAPVARPVGDSAGTTATPSVLNQTFEIDYEGDVDGLLKICAGKLGVWEKLASDGQGVIFYKSETKTFYLPALPNKSKGSSQIAANSTTSSGGGSAGSSGGSAGSSSSNLIGASTTTDFVIDLWADLERVAQNVAGGAQVSVSSSLHSVTVTGTPVQVRNVEDWVKTVSDNLSQKIAITVDEYVVKKTGEDNYNWNPTAAFASLSGKYGFKLTSPDSPAVVSGSNPLSLTASVLSTATGHLGQFAGSALTVDALSQAGDVVQTMHQTVVTLNGRAVPMQVADVDDYLASETPSSTVATSVTATSVGPTLTPGTLTTGFTATFTPSLVNGKVLLAIDVTDSTNNGFQQVGTATNFIQTRHFSVNTFQQSTSLTPGESLLLTSIQKFNGQSKRSGIGDADVHVLGGGLDDTSTKLLTAIVVTAKVIQ